MKMVVSTIILSIIIKHLLDLNIEQTYDKRGVLFYK
jgi:hypothetical protein